MLFVYRMVYEYVLRRKQTYPYEINFNWMRMQNNTASTPSRFIHSRLVRNMYAKFIIVPSVFPTTLISVSIGIART